MEPTPVFFLGEFHGQRRLVGSSLSGHKESDLTEQLHSEAVWLFAFICAALMVSKDE